MTIGIWFVACLAARTAGVSHVTMISTRLNEFSREPLEDGPFYLPPFEIRPNVLSFLIIEMLQLILEDADKPARGQDCLQPGFRSRPFWPFLVRPSAKMPSSKCCDEFPCSCISCVPSPANAIIACSSVIRILATPVPASPASIAPEPIACEPLPFSRSVEIVWLRSTQRVDGKAAYHPANVAHGFWIQEWHAAIQVFRFSDEKKPPVLPGRFLAVQSPCVIRRCRNVRRHPSGAARLPSICCLRLRSGLCRGRGHRWLCGL